VLREDSLIPWLWPLGWQMAAWAAYFDSLAAMQNAMLKSAAAWAPPGTASPSEVVEFPAPTRASGRTSRVVAAPVVPLRPSPR
jgi:hypothetical protein